MAYIKCSKCGKRISDKEKKCTKCGTKIKCKNDNKKYKNIILGFIVFFVIFGLIYCLYSVKEDILFSSEMMNLYIFIFISLLVCLLSVISFKLICSLKKNSKLYFVNIILFICFCLGGYYCYLGINAYRYDNSIEVYNLASNHSLKTAKKYKNMINEVFEIEDDISVRNVNIKSFYKDEEYYVLYLDDFYNNYSLKYYLNIEDENIIDVYWLFNDEKFYLVKDGLRDEKFSYYYAMSILNEVLGEDISGLANIDDEVKKKLINHFDESANMIITYDDFKYDNGKFIYSGSIDNMDFSVNMEEVNFDIIFKSLETKKNKKIWYYGDSSFDYVDWDVKIK